MYSAGQQRKNTVSIAKKHVWSPQRSVPRHRALDMCSTTIIFAHQASTIAIKPRTLLKPGLSASSAQHPSNITLTSSPNQSEPTNFFVAKDDALEVVLG